MRDLPERVERLPELRPEPWLRGYTRLRLPARPVHAGAQDNGRGRGWRVRLDEDQQGGKGVGRDEDTRRLSTQPKRASGPVSSGPPRKLPLAWGDRSGGDASPAR